MEMKKKRKKKRERGRTSLKHCRLTTAEWKQMEYYSWDAVTGLCATLLQLNTNGFW